MYVNQGDQFYLRGITSASLLHANMTCDITNHAIFTNVLKFVDWISVRAFGPDGIKKEALKVLENLRMKISKEFKNLKSQIQSRATLYRNLFILLRNTTADELSKVGSQGTAITLQITEVIDKWIETVDKEFSDAALQPIASASILRVQTDFIDPIYKYIKVLEKAVQENPKAYKCWDDKKQDLKDIFSKVPLDIKTVIEEKLKEIDGKLENLKNKVIDSVLRIATELWSQCGQRGPCYEEYVRYNSQLQFRFHI